ncbi:uncharacterized protein [Littorina saxatilis]|uniref:uncharacterized protein isoform X2 n=1 Tax=Littorina saxatilis TaxID=31220 RepID=UPI0038B49861
MMERRCKALEMETDMMISNKCVTDLRMKTLKTQERTLRNWETECQQRNALCRTMACKSGVAPENLVSTRLCTLPPLQNHSGPSYGPESDFPQRTQSARYYPGTAFFLLPEYIGPEDDCLMVCLKWSERQFYKPPISIVKPDLDEEILFNDYRGNRPETTSEQDTLKQLCIRGVGLLPEPVSESARNTSLTAETSWSSELRDFCFRRTSSQSQRSLSRFEPYPCGPRLESPYFVRNIVPAFKLDRFTFMWGQYWFHGIVEIGIVSNAGEKGSTQILLANPGCCVMRYSWRRVPRVDHFNTGRYRTSPFIFDFSDGIILPEQKVSLRVEFFSKIPGRWTERWYVKTTPSVGVRKTGEIPVNVWGQAMDIDANAKKRNLMDDELEMSAVQRLSERSVWDLITFLPIRSRHSLMKEVFPPVEEGRHPDDIAAFHEKNPGLYYHSKPMNSLLAAHVLLDKVLNPIGDHVEKSFRRPSSASVTFRQGKPKPSRGRSPGAQRKISTLSGKAVRTTPISKPKSDRPRALSYTPEAMWFHKCVQSYQYPRAEVVAKEFHSLALCLDEEPASNKEKILKMVNMSILSMSKRSFSSPMRHYKDLMMRAALSRLFDDISSAERKLRYDLGLLEDQRFKQLATFGNESSQTSSSAGSERVTKGGGTTRSTRGSGVGFNIPSKLASTSSLDNGSKVNLESLLIAATGGGEEGGKGGEGEPVAPIDWTATAPRQWKEKLTTLVYSHLVGLLDSVQPVLNHDGFWLNPLKPRPEK